MVYHIQPRFYEAEDVFFICCHYFTRHRISFPCVVTIRFIRNGVFCRTVIDLSISNGVTAPIKLHVNCSFNKKQNWFYRSNNQSLLYLKICGCYFPNIVISLKRKQWVSQSRCCHSSHNDGLPDVASFRSMRKRYGFPLALIASLVGSELDFSHTSTTLSVVIVAFSHLLLLSIASDLVFHVFFLLF